MKKYNIDGLPGFTMQGKKGKTGERGCMTFCNVMNTYNITKKNEYAIGVVIDDKDESITPITFPSNKMIPILGDYIIDVLPTTSNLYVIDDVYEFTKETFPIVESSYEINYNDLDEDEIFNITLSMAITPLNGFKKFIASLSSNDSFKIFKLSLLNSWLYNQGLSKKDLELSVYAQSYDIYRTPWKGEYTPKYVKKEISYVSSPYVPFAHVKEGTNYVIDNKFQISNLTQNEMNNTLYAKYPWLYYNSSSLSNYYTDILEYDLDELGYICKKGKYNTSHPWLDVNQFSNYNILDDLNLVSLTDKGEYVKNSYDDINLISNSSYDMNRLQKTIICNLNAAKKDSSEDDGYQHKFTIQNMFNNEHTLIIKRNLDKQDNYYQEHPHYLSFLKLHLSNKLNSKNKVYVVQTNKTSIKENEIFAEYGISLENNIDFYTDSDNKQKLNVTIFLGKNHFNYNQSKLLDVDESIIIDEETNTPQKVYGDNHIKISSYDCKYVNKSQSGEKDIYTFNDYSIKVYDAESIKINSFLQSNQYKVENEELSYTISGISAPYCFYYLDDNFSQMIPLVRNGNSLNNEYKSDNLYEYCYLDSIINNSNFINDDPENEEIEINRIGKIGTNKTITPITLEDLYLVIDLVQLNNNDDIRKTDINVNDTCFKNVPYIINSQVNSHTPVKSFRKIYNLLGKSLSSIDISDDESLSQLLNSQKEVLAEIKNNKIYYSKKNCVFNNIKDNYGILVSLYSHISKPVYDTNEHKYTFTDDSYNSFELICESSKIFRLSDLFNLFLDKDKIDIPFALLCNSSTFTDALYSSFGFNDIQFYENNKIYLSKNVKEGEKSLLSIEIYKNLPSVINRNSVNKFYYSKNDFEDLQRACEDPRTNVPNLIPVSLLIQKYIISEILPASFHINLITKQGTLDVIKKNDCLNILYNARTGLVNKKLKPTSITNTVDFTSNKLLEFNNITQCIEISGIETDDEGNAIVPIISTMPSISYNNEQITENNVFAFIKVGYDNLYSKIGNYYLDFPFYEGTCLIDKLFYNHNENCLSCYLLPRNFYRLEDPNFQEITGILSNEIKENDNIIGLKYYNEDKQNYYWNEYITPKYLINERTSFAEKSGETPLGGKFTVINGNIIYYDTKSPSLLSKSNRLQQYDILTNTFPEIEKDPEELTEEEKIDNIEELLDYRNNLVPSKKTYSLLQFIVESSWSQKDTKNVRIEVEFFKNVNVNVKNVSTCLDDKWNTDAYSSKYINLQDNAIQQKNMIEIMYDLYMKEIHNSSSVITENISELPNIANPPSYPYTLWTLKLYEEQAKYDYYNENINANQSINEFKDYINNNSYINPLKYAYTSSFDLNNFGYKTPYMYSRLGLSRNFKKDLNFDNEDIFPCTLVIKDYEDELINGTFSSTIIFPKSFINSCNMKIYAYIKNSSSSATKILLGESKVSDTF